MIYIIIQENEDTLIHFGTKLQGVLGINNVRVVPSCGDFELKFVFDNYKEHDTLTIIGIHPKYEQSDAVKWAGKYEKAFNIPVFIGKVWSIWQ